MKILIFLPQNSLKIQEWWFATDQDKKFRKSQFFKFCQFFFFVLPKISILSRVQAPKFQNNVILDMKNALIGGKKVKTQLLRRRGHRKIQKENYLTSKKLQGQNDPPPLGVLGLRHSNNGKIHKNGHKQVLQAKIILKQLILAILAI